MSASCLHACILSACLHVVTSATWATLGGYLDGNMAMLQVSKGGRRTAGKLSSADEARRLAGASHLDSCLGVQYDACIIFSLCIYLCLQLAEGAAAS